jgi:DNA processing protein
LVKQHCDFIVTPDDTLYPSQLLPYADHPPIIFGQGNLQALLQPQIAIVGSRKPSPHGRQVAYDFAYYLSEKGFLLPVVWHMGLMKQHIRVVYSIIVPSRSWVRLDTTYPTANQDLRQHSTTRCIISEFLPQTLPLQRHFPRRNRIVSGLSLGVLVVEAKQKVAH